MNYRIRMRNLREDGRAELKIDDLIKLCRFYGVSADYFIGISDEK